MYASHVTTDHKPKLRSGKPGHKGRGAKVTGKTATLYRSAHKGSGHRRA